MPYGVTLMTKGGSSLQMKSDELSPQEVARIIREATEGKKQAVFTSMTDDGHIVTVQVWPTALDGFMVVDLSEPLIARPDIVPPPGVIGAKH